MAELQAFIPARAGSKRVKNKNLLPVAGVPLVIRAIEIARKFTDSIWVSTDSDVIAQLVEGDGVKRHYRSPGLYEDDVTLDEVLTDFFNGPPRHGHPGTIVIQPDVVFYPFPVEDIDVMLESDVPVALGIRTHSIWSRKHIGPRLNTQVLADNQGPWQELGIRFYPPGSESGVIKRLHRITDDVTQYVDIATPTDLVAADRLLSKLHIVFRFVYGTDIGTGHLYRSLTLANHLQHHNVSLTNISTEDVPDDMSGGWSINQYPEFFFGYDVIVNDVLQTTVQEMALLRQYAPVIAVEDAGTGADLATHAVNALYKDNDLTFSGSDWAILRPEFITAKNVPIKDRDIDVLVTFGGTDPNGLTERLHATFAENGYDVDKKIVFVQPPGSPKHLDGAEVSPNMATLLSRSKMVFTSGGRTLYEAAATGTPAFVICQNIRESTHAHLGFEFGNNYLGMHNFLTRMKILGSLRYTTDETLQQMSDQAYRSIDRKGLQRFLSLIEFTAMEGQ